MNERGELTTQQIIIIIILIASFVVLLFFLSRLNPDETSSKQICYNSVTLVSKGKGLVGGLDCRTNYLCISGGQKCENFNPTSTASVDASKKDEILKALADEMADCWWMFGEGKIDYASGLLQSSTHCAICSSIKFDEKIRAGMKQIKYSELYDYMKTHQSSHDTAQSYLKYLYGVNSMESSNTELKGFDLNMSPIATDKDYMIITGIDPEFPYIFSDENIKVHILRPDEAREKAGCQIFDITKAG